MRLCATCRGQFENITPDCAAGAAGADAGRPRKVKSVQISIALQQKFH
jgi:hypothetical protein